MKKTLTVNLNNIVFHIDSDAYEALHNYLSEVESRLSENERREVMTDIEARVAELFSEKLDKGKNVITIEDVETVIAVLGKPNQFASDDEESAPDNGQSTDKNQRRTSRKYYRDPDNAMLGGVAAGLAAFFGWDVVAVRIILVILLFLSYTALIPIYLLVWLIVPAARTVAQKLEMQGEPVTADRIKEEVNNMKSYVKSEEFEKRTSTIGTRLGEVFRAIFKVIFGIVGAIMGFIGFIILGSLLFVLGLFIFEPSVFSGFIPDLHMLTASQATLMVIALLLVVGIPIFALIYGAIRIISGKKGISTPLNWILFIAWFAGIFLFAGLSARSLVSVLRGEGDHISFYWNEDIYETETTKYLSHDEFHSLDVSGNIKVELRQDSAFSVIAKAGPTLLSHLETRNENGTLKIYTDKFHLRRQLVVYVSMPELRSLKVSGTSEVDGDGRFSGDYLNLEMSGMSKADLDVHVNKKLLVEQTSATELNLSGMAYSMDYYSSGASHFKADELLVRTAKIKGNGIVHVRTNVTDTLDVSMSGGSQFNNKYRPVYHHQQVSGAASINFN